MQAKYNSIHSANLSKCMAHISKQIIGSFCYVLVAASSSIVGYAAGTSNRPQITIQ